MATLRRGLDNYSVSLGVGYSSRRASEDYRSRNKSRLDTYSDRFKSKVSEITDRVKNSRLAREVVSSYRRLKNAGNPDAIRQLIDVGAMQHASPKMRKYIMSDPRIKHKYRAKLIEGYFERYYDTNVNALGDTDRNHRIIYDGVVVKDESGTYAKTYAIDKEDRLLLNNYERSEVRISVSNILLEIEKGDDDPTSVYNASLSRP